MAAESARVAQRCEEAKHTCQLNLKDCDLRKIPDAIYLFMKGVELQSVCLAHNDLKLVPTKFGSKLITITKVMSGKGSIQIDAYLAEANPLHSIHDLLFSSSLFLIPFSSQLLAWVLDLSYNQLTTLPAELSNLVHLQQLDISYNHYTSIPDVIRELRELKDLDISHNQIPVVPAELKNLSLLQCLKTSHNLLTVLPSIQCFPNLKVLDASHNHISNCEVDDLTSSPWLEEIDLRGNPLEEHICVFLQSVVRLKILVDIK